MHLPARRALVAVLALAMTMALSGFAAAAPAIRNRPAATRPNPDVVLRGSGWGHGVGMSQYGAYAAAKAGWGYKRILAHYYPGTDVGPRPMPSSVRVGLGQAMGSSNVEAVTGGLPWRICDDGGCERVAWQPKGSTWTVTITDTGKYRLADGSTPKWRGSGRKLLASFNPAAEGDGTAIEAYSPNGPRRLYKWGTLEYSVTATGSQTMFMVLDIPSIELYLRGLGEMPIWWGAEGPAALQVQAAAARSYALLRHSRYGGMNPSCRCSLYATMADQVYNGYDKELEDTNGYWRAAVNATAGMVPRYEGRAIEALYSSSHGGRTENSEDSYAFDGAEPYLRSVDDPWSLRAASGNPNISWDYAISNGSFSNFVGGLSRVRRVRVIGSRTDGGTPKTLRVWGMQNGDPVVRERSGDKGIVGVSLKDAYGPYGLKSQQIRRFGFQPFTDDDGSVHEYAIVFAEAAGLMTGKTARRFGPDGEVTRAAAAVYLYKTLRLAASTKDYYSDDNHLPAAVEEAINALARAEISGGLRRGLFRPADALTRAQAATLFFRALDPVKATRDYYSDDDGSPHEVAINALTRKGLMSGCSATRFCPGRVVRRGQMATLLYRTVNSYR